MAARQYAIDSHSTSARQPTSEEHAPPERWAIEGARLRAQHADLVTKIQLLRDSIRYISTVVMHFTICIVPHGMRHELRSYGLCILYDRHVGAQVSMIGNTASRSYCL